MTIKIADIYEHLLQLRTLSLLNTLASTSMLPAPHTPSPLPPPLPSHPQEELTLEGYRKHLVSQQAAPPLTQAEQELKDIRESEVS